MTTQTSHQNATNAGPTNGMKWLKRVGLALLVLLLLLVAAGGWLLGTGAGLRFTLAQLQSATHGALQVQQASGRLAGPLDLTGIHYDDGNGTVASVATLHLNLRIWPLLAKRVHVVALDLDGVEVALPTAPVDTAVDDGSAFSLRPPVELILDQIHVGKVRLSRAGEPLFGSDSLDLAGSWTNQGITLRQLALKAPDGHADLTGKLALSTQVQGNGSASFAWKLDDTDYAGDLTARSDGKQATLQLKLTAPTVIQLQLNLKQSGDYAWSGQLDAPRFNPKPLLGDSALTALAVALTGHGDRHSGTLTGRLDLNDYPLLVQPLSIQLSDDLTTLTLQKLKLGSPKIKGELEANGTLQLDAKPLSAELAIRWTGLELPHDLVGQTLSSEGQLQLTGNLGDYHAEGALSIGPPGQTGQLALNLDGDAQQITVHTLALEQAHGKLQTNGTLTWQPAIAWQAEAKAEHFDPGKLFAGWNGALDFHLTSSGSLAQAGPDATLEIVQLGGKLRPRRYRLP